MVKPLGPLEECCPSRVWGKMKFEWHHFGAGQREVDMTVSAEEKPKKEWGSRDVSPTFSCCGIYTEYMEYTVRWGKQLRPLATTLLAVTRAKQNNMSNTP